jgi:hypothetical protein
VAQRFQRCDKCIILNPALATEAAHYLAGMSFSATTSVVPHNPHRLRNNDPFVSYGFSHITFGIKSDRLQPLRRIPESWMVTLNSPSLLQRLSGKAEQFAEKLRV